MNRSFAATFILAGALLAPAAYLVAQDNNPPPPSSPSADHGEKTTELGQRMKRIAKAMKALGKQINDPSANDSSIVLIGQMKTAAKEALQFKPEKEADLPPDQQPAFQHNYEVALKQAIGVMDQIEDALKANDNATAAQLFKKLGQTERKDHHEFRKPHDD